MPPKEFTGLTRKQRGWAIAGIGFATILAGWRLWEPSIPIQRTAAALVIAGIGGFVLANGLQQADAIPQTNGGANGM